MSSIIPLTILSLDTDETVRNLSIEFSVALLHLAARLFMFLLIFNEQRVSKITFVLVLTYYVKPHLFVILTVIGWFIVSIQSDLFWHRCLERQAFGTPRMYTLSPSKSIKGSNYGEFLKDKNVLLCTRLYKYAPNLESLLTQQYVCVMCTLWSDNTCVFTRFHSVKNANMQLIWSFDIYFHFIPVIMVLYTYKSGLTKPGKVGDFFALVSMKSPNFCQKGKFLSPLSVFSSQYFSHQ
jgi:hypothetical protein